MKNKWDSQEDLLSEEKSMRLSQNCILRGNFSTHNRKIH